MTTNILTSCNVKFLDPYIRKTFVHSGYFYSAFSSPPLLRGAPDTARILCQRFTTKRHRQLRVKDLSKVPMWWLEWDSNPRPFGRKPTIYQCATLPHKTYKRVFLFVCIILVTPVITKNYSRSANMLSTISLSHHHVLIAVKYTGRWYIE